MAKCPFLSTYKNRVNCFKECPFHEYEDSNGECPFMSIDMQESIKRDYIYNEIFKSQSINLLDELYEEKNFTKIFESV
ncbi:hypothetical protein CLOHAE12215_01648 [Clostridium haemolyticum]|uniref:hypothetical protein n=1 Tax=Clostridium haemolyticum TaxID=84025 RepID=UPI001C3A24A7|nr:hypothetical protein [Clostridium haemolyticum]CAG7840224.1 hypothetical protein CLOHAE12215_01648 [Clostridium haemolyticum]